MQRKKLSDKASQKTTNASEALIKLLCVLDDIFDGRVGGRKIRHTFWKDFVNAILTNDVATVADLNMFIKEDAELPKIRRTFKDYELENGTLTALLGSSPSVASLLLTALSLSAFAQHEDLQTDVITLGAFMVKKKEVQDLVTCVRLLQQKKRVLPQYFTAFSTLRDMCQTYSLAGSLRSLPNVTLSMTEGDSDFKEIVTSLSRYSVYNDVFALEKDTHTSLQEVIEDILDIFKDYSKGKLRVNALKKLPSVVALVIATL
jgi:hypothetical protein